MKKLKINQDFVIRQVADNMVLLNSKTGDYFGLNQVGTDFIRLLQNNIEYDEIIRTMLTLYDVEASVLRADIDELAEKMLAKSILIDQTESGK